MIVMDARLPIDLWLMLVMDAGAGDRSVFMGIIPKA